MSIYLCGKCNQFHNTVAEMKKCNHEKKEKVESKEETQKTTKKQTKKED